MTAAFFALAFAAALNPKLLALDLLLIENRRSRAMFVSVLLGGLTTGVVLGWLDVLVFRVDALGTQDHLSAGVDLALGLFLLAGGALMVTGRLFHRGTEPAAPPDAPTKGPTAKDRWAARVLGEPRLGLAAMAGVLIGLPGASYLAAMHHLVVGNYATTTDVVAVVVFVVIAFSLIIVPFAFVELRPEATKRAVRATQGWLIGHARRFVGYGALLLGAYLAVSGLARLI